MSYWGSGNLPGWPDILGAAAYFTAGAIVGILYFRALWWQTRMFAQGAPIMKVIALMGGRFALMLGSLLLASLDGAIPLLAMALGVLAGRQIEMRKFGKADP